ncbi:hypothetical protein F5J12DRAFT_894370 [Pisolithus orientalis]|uniref:uncharacterized protein n=1 Tax=Pisolithus orientalis TaxID=936130 RepID=UPI002224DFCE|nr:uncharacterized protein F5J12DRAFT_894370 [Pisolithus orientalis]KAI6002300.1 hypothetical protein F5J12DRAFT_894370 [Pisolithus orientalis]
MSAHKSLEAVQLQARSLIKLPFANINFTLSGTAVAGLLGGDEASSTVALTQIYARRRWLGWYNSPGSYVTGKRFRRLIRSAKVDAVFDSDPKSGATSGGETIHIDPRALFEHEGWSEGPAFKGIYSGTSIQNTGPLASWLMKKVDKARCQKIEGRKTQPVNITVTVLEQANSIRPQMTFDHHTPTFAIIPIIVSLATCVICGLCGQWHASSMILLGMLSRGFSCLLIGSGDLIFDHPKPAEGSPPGNGILSSDHELVLLKGDEYVVNAVTRGRFFFCFRSKHDFRMVKLCSFFLITQAIVQLICVPQSEFFGQLMFVVSVATSWVYNFWFSSVDKAEVEGAIFKDVLGDPCLTKLAFPNRVSAVVFLLLVSNDFRLSSDPEPSGDPKPSSDPEPSGDSKPSSDPEPPSDHRPSGDPKPSSNSRPSSDPGILKEIMDSFLPSGSQVWEIWKQTIIKRLESRKALRFNKTDWNCKILTSKDQRLLETLFGDAEDAEKAYAIFVSSAAATVP